jgi:hypothetical protein
MTDGDRKPDGADLYRLIRTDTERVVNEFLAVMRHRREESVEAHLRERRNAAPTDDGPLLTESDLAAALEIRMSHSAGFAHALLQGAVEAFDDQKSGLQILKRLVDLELAEMDQDASIARQATSVGSTAIN